ncbi:MAG: class SAM-dependent methyltransferase [Rhodospirillales bacterium]|jgi:tRNA (cmo5U34)-methyltransferase|nr:class SAM-dependent methyltransferase [Rhodospirillales bacterium]
MSFFSDPDAVARYAEGPVRLVPGFHHLQRMAALLLAERMEKDARVLVLGAGGGLELKAFADWYPQWTFDGVDPSAEMLNLARTMLGPLAARVDLHEGYIDVAPEGPFDGAACLLTLHFVPRDERLRTLTQVYRRLRQGAPFVVAHHSFPQADGAQSLWLDRYAAFAAASGVPLDNARTAVAAMAERLPILSPDEDEALLHEAGFSDVALFYAGFTFRGWVGYRT